VNKEGVGNTGLRVYGDLKSHFFKKNGILSAEFSTEKLLKKLQKKPT